MKLFNFLKAKRILDQSQNSNILLNGVHVVFLATDGVEHSEITIPMEALKDAGAIVYVVSPFPGKIKTWEHQNWSKTINVDMSLREAWSMEFDALVLPGGILNSDKLRANSEAVAFVISMLNKNRPVATICHGAQILIETGYLKGKKITSWPSIKTDLENAGAHWLNKEVIVDHHIITSQGPSDLPRFIKAILKEFNWGKLHHPIRHDENFNLTI